MTFKPTASIADRVKVIILEDLSVKEDKVTPKTTFDDLGDSLDLVGLLMAFEEEFDIEIPDEVVEKMVTVDDAVDYIFRTLSNSQ